MLLHVLELLRRNLAPGEVACALEQMGATDNTLHQRQCCRGVLGMGAPRIDDNGRCNSLHVAVPFVAFEAGMAFFVEPALFHIYS